MDILVKWHGHDEDNNNWDPLKQLIQGVSVLVTYYVKDNKRVADRTWNSHTRTNNRNR